MFDLTFNQSIIYSEKANDFIFANHGDAYGRGFIIDKLKEMYTDYGKMLYESKYPTLNIFISILSQMQTIICI